MFGQPTERHASLMGFPGELAVGDALEEPARHAHLPIELRQKRFGDRHPPIVKRQKAKGKNLLPFFICLLTASVSRRHSRCRRNRRGSGDWRGEWDRWRFPVEVQIEIDVEIEFVLGDVRKLFRLWGLGRFRWRWWLRGGRGVRRLSASKASRLFGREN